jgi:hypothetical protein
MFGTTMIQNVEISTADFTLIEAVWVECKFVLKRCIAKLPISIKTSVSENTHEIPDSTPREYA